MYLAYVLKSTYRSIIFKRVTLIYHQKLWNTKWNSGWYFSTLISFRLQQKDCKSIWNTKNVDWNSSKRYKIHDANQISLLS